MATKKNGKNGQVKLAPSRLKPPALKTTESVSYESIQMAIRSRFNPIRGLTPQLLGQYLDQYNIGWIAYAALLWDMMERRDDVIKNVSTKRKKDAARLEWSIVLDNPADDQAKAHKEALENFYANCTAVNAMDQNERGGIQLLIRQMMDAVGKKYAVHEIVWQPFQVLTAEFRFVPLWFFENRTGNLQIMPIPIGGAYGEPLEEGGWMITCGDGLMEACSVAYMFKHLPLKDWLSYSDKFGTPGVMGQTTASRDSEAGEAMKQAVASFGQNWSAVIYGIDPTHKIDPIKLVEASTASVNAMPMPGLVDRMDRAMISLWRGADLATMSRGGAERSIGASVQEEESEILLRDDADNISETLNMYVDKYVIWQLFGVAPLAHIELKAPETTDVTNDLKVDELLLNAGARLGERERLNFYGRPQFDEDDIPLHEVSRVTERITPGAGGGAIGAQTVRQVETLPNVRDMDLERYLGPYRKRFLEAFANDLSPLRAAIEHAIGDSTSDARTQRSHLFTLRSQLGFILRHIDERGTAAEVLSEIIANSMKEGVKSAKKETKK